ncbi:MAG: histidine kinase [Bacteroidales bacterium]|nr:histidine kinase [Bacteroidales bacterium]
MLNPVLLSLWATILILLIIPVGTDKYSATLIEKGTYMNEQVVRYDDLDYDGKSERIAVFHNSLGTAGLTVANTNGVLDQWTFRGRYDFVQVPGTVITGDRDDDGMKEIYVFTLSGDSVLLHVIPDYRDAGIPPGNRFIARVGKRKNKYDPYILPAEMDDLTGDGIKELIFGIGTGYSLKPRTVFAWNAASDTLVISPESGYFLQGILQEDIDGDQEKEIIPYGYAASNVRDSAIPYPDRNTWLMVLNRKLLFAFKPLAFPGQYSNLKPVVLSGNLHAPVLAALYRPPENQGDSNMLLRIDPNGKIIKKLPVPGNTQEAFSLRDKKGFSWLLLWRSREGFDLYDTSFILRKTVPVYTAGVVMLIDMDQDGIQEVVISDQQRKQLLVFRNELNHPVSLSVDGEGEKGTVFSFLKKKGQSPLFYIQSGTSFSLFQYGLNPLYKIRFLKYAGIYLSILLFTWLVRKIQRDQLRKKQETEKKITELQLQIIRNQLDPHFIMNAVNSIIVSISDKGKEEAKQLLLHFSRLHRSLLMSSDQIQRTLQEEIEFTGNYLALEKFRFRDKFDYHLDIDPAVNVNIQVPKMILQIHAENALKHGIMLLGHRGMLVIRVHKRGESLEMEIQDDGVGREYARTHGGESTGKGLAVMENYSQLFNRYHPGKIKTEIIDLYDDSGNPAGTRVRILISNRNEKPEK